MEEATVDHRPPLATSLRWCKTRTAEGGQHESAMTNLDSLLEDVAFFNGAFQSLPVCLLANLGGGQNRLESDCFPPCPPPPVQARPFIRLSRSSCLPSYLPFHESYSLTIILKLIALMSNSPLSIVERVPAIASLSLLSIRVFARVSAPVRPFLLCNFLHCPGSVVVCTRRR